MSDSIASRFHNQNGSTLLYAAVSLVFLAIMGSSVIEVSGADGAATENAVAAAQAAMNANSGLEWAKYRLNLGLDPATSASVESTPLGSFGRSLRTLAVVDDGAKEFAGGTFAVSSDPETGKVTSTGIVDDAKVTHSLYAAFSGPCFEFLPGADFNFPAEGAGTMENASFHKLDVDAQGRDCADTLVMTALRVSWSRTVDGETVTGVSIDGTSHFDSEDGTVSGTAIDIADFTLSDALTHYFDVIAFAYPDGAPPAAPQTFTIEASFADGSTASANYVYSAASLPPVDLDGLAPDPDGDDFVVDDDSSPGIPEPEDGEPGELVDIIEIVPEDEPTEVVAHVNFNYTLYDHTSFDDMRGVSESYDGDYPCEACEGSLYVRFLDARGGNKIAGGICDHVYAQNHDGYDSSFEHDCVFYFEVASLDEVEAVEFEGYGGISVHIDAFFAHLYHEDGSEIETSLDVSGDPFCIYDTETGIDPGAYHMETYDTGSHDYSVKAYNHKCDDLGYEYVRSITYDLPRARGH